MDLHGLAQSGRQVRAIGFDDAPFQRRRGARVPVSGVVCSGTRFEGMVFGHVRQDGWNATDVLSRLLIDGKFIAQLHVVLLDGIALGGFNVVDLPLLHQRLGLPCVATMRRMPDRAAVERAIRRLPNPRRRLDRLARAGAIHQLGGFTFQAVGAAPADVATALTRLTDRGHVPEALRLAHLIGGALVTGQSGRRA